MSRRRELEPARAVLARHGMVCCSTPRSEAISQVAEEPVERARKPLGFVLRDDGVVSLSRLPGLAVPRRDAKSRLRRLSTVLTKAEGYVPLGAADELDRTV